MHLRSLAPSSFLLLSVLLVVPVHATEPVDWEMVTRIRQEGLQRSQALEMLTELTQNVGARLTGSPQMKAANEWARDRMAEWGLDARLEPWGPFGRGWSFRRASAHMLSPHQMPLIVLPLAWTPGTDGPVRGPAMQVQFESEEDLETHRGKLQGKILFIDDARPLQDAREPALSRYTESELADLTAFELEEDDRWDRRPNWRERARKRWELRQKLNPYLVEEGVLAVVDVSSRDGGLVRVGGAGSREVDESPGVPRVRMAAEHYNRVLRLLERDHEVELEIEVDAQFHDEDLMAYNTIADLPGTDKPQEVVLVGGHLDSWHGGTGATDNGAACVVAMEAVRILKTLGVQPRRTIRVALWSGEEQGLLGSRAYVDQHYADFPDPKPEEEDLPRWLRDDPEPPEILPDHAHVSVYFNLDNGAGKIRGIYTQQNAGVVPIFRAWLEPFHDLGATTVTMNDTRGTDHLSFQRVGLPGFQFIQDGLDYFPRTHHTNMDTLDHVVETDLKQAAVVLASFIYHAAMRDDLLPRGPMPQWETESEDDESSASR